MHPVLAEQELQIIHRHRHERIASVGWDRVPHPSPVETQPNVQAPRWIGRGAIVMFATHIGHLATGAARRRALGVHAESNASV